MLTFNLTGTLGRFSRGIGATPLTGDAHFVELSEPLVGPLSRYVVSQADGAEGDEAEVEGLQEVPVALQR